MIVMKKLYVLLSLAALTISSCKKEESLPAPTASFELVSTVSTQGTTYRPLNVSENATSYLWDLGDGITSTEKSPEFTLNKVGVYKISLTVTNDDGNTSISSKEVKIVAPIINSITIIGLNEWVGQNFSSLKKFTGGDVWVEIRKSASTDSYEQATDGSYNYPLFYKSPVVNVPAGTTYPVTIGVDKTVMLDLDPSKKDNHYSFNLYVKDNTGVHMLFTSEFIGSVYMPLLYNNSYSWKSSFGPSVEIKGYYF